MDEGGDENVKYFIIAAVFLGLIAVMNAFIIHFQPQDTTITTFKVNLISLVYSYVKCFILFLCKDSIHRLSALHKRVHKYLPYDGSLIVYVSFQNNAKIIWK